MDKIVKHFEKKSKIDKNVNQFKNLIKGRASAIVPVKKIGNKTMLPRISNLNRKKTNKD